MPSPFSANIQETLVTLLCFQTEGGDVVSENVPIDLYDPPYRPIAAKATAFRNEYHRPPGSHTLDLIDDLCRENPDAEESIRHLYVSMMACKDDDTLVEYIEIRIRNFVVSQKFKSEFQRAAPLVHQGDMRGVRDILLPVLQDEQHADDFFLTYGDWRQRDMRIKYLLDNVVVEGQPMGIMGATKSLKTSIALDLCVSLAGEVEFLGYFPAAPAVPVAIASGESGMPIIMDLIDRIIRGRHRGLHQWQVDLLDRNLHLWDKLPQIKSPSVVAQLDRFIRKYGIKLLVIDPAYMVMGGKDANNAMVFAEMIKGITEMCQRNKCTLVLVHHTTKAAGKDGAKISLDDAQWSGYSMWIGQWIKLRRLDEYDPEVGSHRLEMDVGGRAGHSGSYHVDIIEGRRGDVAGRKWVPLVTTASQGRHEEAVATRETTQQREREMILSYLRDHPNSTKTDMRDGITPNGKRVVGNHLDALVREEIITATPSQPARGGATIMLYAIAGAAGRRPISTQLPVS